MAALIEAAFTGDIAKGTEFLANGGDIEYQTDAMDYERMLFFGTTALIAATVGKQHEFVKFLLDKGCKLDTKNAIGSALRAAVLSNSIDTVKLLLDKGSSVDIPDANGNTPIMAASLHNYVEVAKLLIDKKCNLNLKDNGTHSPVHIFSNQFLYFS